MSSGPMEAWNAYWAEGRLAACLRNEKGNYGGVIGSSWSAFFAALPPGSRLLDVASGNGALALLALNISDQHSLDFNIEACDLAQIDPVAALPEQAQALARIRFHGGTAAESMPFADDSFDVITSQYGLEYSDWKRSLAEACRLLAPGGVIRLVSHSTDSSVFNTTAEQLAELHELSKAELTGKVLTLLQASGQETVIAREAFNRHASRVMHRLDNSTPANRIFISQYLKRLGEIYQQRKHSDATTTRDALDQLNTDLERHAERLHALRQAALGMEDLAEMQQFAAGLGLSLQLSEPLVDPSDGATLGRLIQWQRRTESSHG